MVLPIPFLNARATKVGSLPFFCTKSVVVATSLDTSKKRGPNRSSTPKALSFDVKIAKIGPADLKIICLREIIKKDADIKKRKKIYSPSGKFAERAK